MSRTFRSVVLVGIALLVQVGALSVGPSARADDGAPPPPVGYFGLLPVGSWPTLPSGGDCAGMVHRSTWEPRPDNDKRNHVLVDPAAVHAAFASRIRSEDGTYDPQWDAFLLARVDGQYSGTTDEIFQWAACKWGLPDDLLRAIAVRESTWYQFEAYPSNRCRTNYGCGDFFSQATPASQVFCDAIGRYGYDYEADYGQGQCPKTFSIVGEMSWWDPTWGYHWADNQDGTFPFNRDSTAFAVDYLAANLRGCYEGWQWELGRGYGAGDIWGCVGAWYSGGWHDADADGYISRVQNEMAITRWLDPEWPTDHPGCDQYGCPGPDTLGENDTTPPTVSIVKPVDGVTRRAGRLFRAIVSAADNTRVAQVSIYINGMVHNVDFTAPYTFLWRPVAGWNTLYAVAMDAYGNTATSVTVHVFGATVHAPAKSKRHHAKP